MMMRGLNTLSVELGLPHTPFDVLNSCILDLAELGSPGKSMRFIEDHPMNFKSVFYFLLLLPASHPVLAAEYLVSTIENIGRPYDVIGGHCEYSEAAGFSFKGDPIQGAITKAFTNMRAYAQQVGADALVGYDIDFANRTEKDEGRVLLCGTLVKQK